MTTSENTAITTVAELVAIIGNRRKPCGKIATVVHSLTDGNIREIMEIRTKRKRIEHIANITDEMLHSFALQLAKSGLITITATPVKTRESARVLVRLTLETK